MVKELKEGACLGLFALAAYIADFVVEAFIKYICFSHI
jgi:hypothetical protein